MPPRDGAVTCFPHTCGDVPAENSRLGTPIGFSPHMWGCSELLGLASLRHFVFPTHVGMFRRHDPCHAVNFRFPHTCGDVPRVLAVQDEPEMFSPHMWGCSGIGLRDGRAQEVFPTHVGMFRGRTGQKRRTFRFPHTCGDVPRRDYFTSCLVAFSPHMWGCSGKRGKSLKSGKVFPTHVGMFLRSLSNRQHIRRFPHTCGDVPSEPAATPTQEPFSPHMWGCSEDGRSVEDCELVFPTHVGMFR